MTVRNSFNAISDVHLIEHNWLQSKSANNRTSYHIHEVRSDTVECYHEVAVSQWLSEHDRSSWHHEQVLQSRVSASMTMQIVINLTLKERPNGLCIRKRQSRDEDERDFLSDSVHDLSKTRSGAGNWSFEWKQEMQASNIVLWQNATSRRLAGTLHGLMVK